MLRTRHTLYAVLRHIEDVKREKKRFLPQENPFYGINSTFDDVAVAAAALLWFSSTYPIRYYDRALLLYKLHMMDLCVAFCSQYAQQHEYWNEKREKKILYTRKGIFISESDRVYAVQCTRTRRRAHGRACNARISYVRRTRARHNILARQMFVVFVRRRDFFPRCKTRIKKKNTTCSSSRWPGSGG